MVERRYSRISHAKNIKNHYFEIETENKDYDYVLYQIAKKSHPDLEYGGFYPLKDKLPDGWKKLDGTLTAPNGYYWASNGKSLFSKERESALIKE